jgi:hypothetical protein
MTEKVTYPTPGLEELPRAGLDRPEIQVVETRPDPTA